MSTHSYKQVEKLVKKAISALEAYLNSLSTSTVDVRALMRAKLAKDNISFYLRGISPTAAGTLLFKLNQGEISLKEIHPRAKKNFQWLFKSVRSVAKDIAGVEAAPLKSIVQ